MIRGEVRDTTGHNWKGREQESLNPGPYSVKGRGLSKIE